MLVFRTKRRSRLTPMRTMANRPGSGNKDKIESPKAESMLKAPPKGSPSNASLGEFKVPADRSPKITRSESSCSQNFNPSQRILRSDMIVKSSSSMAPLRVIQWDEERHVFLKTKGNNEKLQKDLRLTFGPLQDLRIQQAMSTRAENSVEAKVHMCGGDDETKVARNKYEWDEEDEDSEEAKNKHEAQEALLMLSNSRELDEVHEFILHDDHQETSTPKGSLAKGKRSSRTRCRGPSSPD